MSNKTTIEWAEVNWNPVLGCTKVSEGCRNCYALTMSARIANMAYRKLQKGEKVTERQAAYMKVVVFDAIEDKYIAKWTDKLIPLWTSVDEPFAWAEPRVVFVNSMSDLFHPDVPDIFIKRIFEVMNQCPQHIFQILTKRPERVAAMSKELEWGQNIWMGTSVEDVRVTKRISALKKTRAKVKFLSVEPLLGPIQRLPIAGINWVIVGGESGAGARPMQADWVRDLRDRCVDRGVAFFFKQWGKLANNPDPDDPTAKENGGTAKGGRLLDGRMWDQMPTSDTIG